MDMISGSMASRRSSDSTSDSSPFKKIKCHWKRQPDMFDRSQDNPPIPSFLRLVTAIECSVVFAGGVLLFFLPGLASDLWPWSIPPFNSRFVGAIYLAAYVSLILFWFVPRWKPG